METAGKETPAKKAATPSVSQINAEYVTQVVTRKISVVNYSFIELLICFVYPEQIGQIKRVPT